MRRQSNRLPKNVVWTLMLACNLAPAFAVDDPFLGTWNMNIAASKFPPLEMPRKMVIVMSATPQGVDYRSELIQQDGRTVTAQYEADYSGHLAMVVGNSGLLAPISVRRIDPRTVEVAYIRGFSTVANSRRVVSEDGRVLTITTASLEDPATPHTTVGVYLKSVTKTTKRSYEGVSWD